MFREVWKATNVFLKRIPESGKGACGFDDTVFFVFFFSSELMMALPVRRAPAISPIKPAFCILFGKEKAD